MLEIRRVTLIQGSVEINGKFVGFVNCDDPTGKFPWRATDSKGTSTHATLGAAIDWLAEQTRSSIPVEARWDDDHSKHF